MAWIELISKELESYKPTYDFSNIWIADMHAKLTALASGPAGRGEPPVQSLLFKICSELPNADASDIQLQLEQFNSDGYRVAGEMLTDPDWSTPTVSARWGTIPKYTVAIDFEAGARTFYPVTVNRDQRILLKVEPTSFDPAFGLLSYLTLEFQFMHEYVSHALPIWINGTLEEVLLLAVTYRFYPLSQPIDGFRSVLANTLRESRKDQYSTARDRVSNFAGQIGQKQFSRFILTLANTDEAALSKTKKVNLATKLKSLPLSDKVLQNQCNKHLSTPTPGPPEFEALRDLIPSRR